jgi:flagellar assembly protein FliH
MSSKVLTGDEARSAVSFSWDIAAAPHPAAGIVERPSESDAAETEACVRAAWEEGYRSGRQEGLAEGRLAWEESGKRMARSVADLAGTKARLRCEVEREAVCLAVTMARRILRREIHVDPEALHGVCKAAFERVSMREATAVRVHPGIKVKVEGWLREVGSPARLEVSGDASLEEGAFIVETTRGTLDASVDTQLDEIDRGFADLLPAE